MLVVEKQVVSYVRRTLQSVQADRRTQHGGDGQQTVIHLHGGICFTRSGSLAGGGPEAVGPPVGPRLPMHRQFRAVLFFDVGEELLRGGESEFRPRVSLVPCFDQVTGNG